MMKRVVIVLLAGLVCCGASQADEAADWQKMRRIVPRSYLCRPAVSAIEVDGRLGEKAWRMVPWSQAFLDIEGTVKPLPRFLTRMKMTWDSESLSYWSPNAGTACLGDAYRARLGDLP